MITISHRLQTVMDSDKILVIISFLNSNYKIKSPLFNFKCLSNGQLINYGRPYDLLQDNNSILYDFVHQLCKDEEKRLLEIAKKHADGEQYLTKQNLSSENEDELINADESEPFLRFNQKKIHFE